VKKDIDGSKLGFVLGAIILIALAALVLSVIIYGIVSVWKLM